MSRKNLGAQSSWVVLGKSEGLMQVSESTVSSFEVEQTLWSILYSLRTSCKTKLECGSSFATFLFLLPSHLLPFPGNIPIKPSAHKSSVSVYASGETNPSPFVKSMNLLKTKG